MFRVSTNVVIGSIGSKIPTYPDRVSNAVVYSVGIPADVGKT